MPDAPPLGPALVRLAAAGAAAGFLGGFATALRRPRPVLLYGPACPGTTSRSTAAAPPARRPRVVELPEPRDAVRLRGAVGGGVGA